jgi:tetraacyldisaccharide 4'-kinase
VPVGRIDPDGFRRLIRGEATGLAPSLARAGLGLTSRVYAGAVRLRNSAFDRGWLTVHHAEVPVVSVGNLTLGGTGKTPTVEWVARWFRRQGLRVVLLSRGYGEHDGLNDEGLVLDENLPDVPHLQGADRSRLARIAVEELEAQVLVLDDGMQHRKLARDVELVVIDALDPFGLERLFPRGLLREPIAGLRRASAVLLSRADLASPADREAIRSRVACWLPQDRWVETRQAPIDLISADGSIEPIDSLRGRRIAAFCGLGNPEGFRRTLLPLCRELVDFRVFPDHHRYGPADVDSLQNWAAGLGVDLVLTTQKDSVKLRLPSLGHLPLHALRIGLEILCGGSVLESTLNPLLSTTTIESPTD